MRKEQDEEVASKKGYAVNDRRGISTGELEEACRVCGGPVHTREYNQPTRACVEFLRNQIAVLKVRDHDQPRIFKWYPPSEVKADVAAQFGVYFPGTDLCVTQMGYQSTGKPGNGPQSAINIEWLDKE